MAVKLISLTNPLVEGINNAEELIVYCARVSNPSNQLNVETSPKLIRYCIEHGHWSIFEQASMCVEIKTSRAIAAQIIRHKSFSVQEFSQRYSTSTSFEDIEFRLQGKTNRQVGDDVIDLSNELQANVDTALSFCKNVYNKLIDQGIAKECARMILPLTTSTTLYLNGTVRSFIHYLQLRTKKDTQKEHRDIALEIQNIFKQQFPNISNALNW
jgi:thymidylate synthase (FAD)